jgi:hypothetical protein
MKRLPAAFLLTTLLACVGPATSQAVFGLHDLDVRATADKAGSIESRAGAHPYSLITELAVNTVEDEVLKFQVPEEDFRSVAIEAPEGFVIDRDATTQCTSVEFSPPGGGSPECTVASIVGHAEVEFSVPGRFFDSPVYNLSPPAGAVARLGFEVVGVPVTIDLGLTQSPPYRGIAHIDNALQVFPVYSSKVALWGVPVDGSHDAERGGAVKGDERPFLTMPSSCTGPLQTIVRATSWQGSSFEAPLESHGDGGEPLGMVDCLALGFGLTITAQPTNHSAEGPTGMDVELSIDDPELTNAAGRAHSDMKRAVVALPEGVTANPSLAEGLGTCSEAELDNETLHSEPGEGCPQSSKIGTVEVESPLLQDVLLHGQLFIATQNENPFGSLLALYLVLKDPGLGILVKLPGKIEPDPHTGQLVTTFGEAGFEIPQLPVSRVRFHLREGGRSPLITPPLCGTYTTDARFTPWANPASTYETTASFQIDSGVGGGPCPPAGTPPFDPGMRAGTLSNDAASHSPFYLRLTRRDADQDLTRFSFRLPPGMTATLAGVSKCSDAEIAQAKTKSGRTELASPSCPVGSQIGTLQSGAGVGSQLTYVPGKVYLAGPYNGAPISAVGIVPAVAGPFDVGTVVVRQALQIDPRSALVTVDGSRSDPIPHILAGIPLKVKDVRVHVDRPDFTLNPTNCDPFAVSAQLWGGGADVFSTADDAPVTRSVPFRAANCARLGFKPALSLSLKGGTRRGAFPAFRFIYTPKPGEANLHDLTLRFPRSEFVEQGHFRTICTRVQFAAGEGNGSACPGASVYGHVTVQTPILDEPLTGNVFLRSSSHNLPDVVLALKGPPSLPIDFEVPARIDSIHGGLRAISNDTPDVPVSKVDLQMQGGQKGLFVNSTNICAAKHRADLRLVAQNGRRLHLRSLLRARGCGGGKASRRRG